jgi:hypothetical protein
MNINKMALEDIDLQKKECVVYDVVGLEIKDTNELRLKDINFTMGGHYYVYPNLIEENRIYLDNCMDKDNMIATSIHEFVERTFMKFYGIQYEDAHKLSNDVEIVVRNFIADKLPDLDKDFIKGR